MKLRNCLLLSVPMFAFAVAAQAADGSASNNGSANSISSFETSLLPSKNGPACSAYGPGFFYLSATNTCMQVGGYYRFNEEYVPGQSIVNVATGKVSQAAGTEDANGMEIRGDIRVDARTPSPWGTVQIVVSLRGTNTDGLRNTAAESEFQTTVTPPGNGATSIIMEAGYVNFLGFRVGVADENFSTMPGPMFGPTIYPGFPNGIKQFAYTGLLGGGLSATLAAESKSDFSGTSVSAGDTTGIGPSAVPYATSVQYSNNALSGVVLVGHLRDTQNWGFVQVAGAVTNNTINGTTLTSAYNPLQDPKGYTGWATGFSTLNYLPFIAPGDQLNIQAQFETGLLGLIRSPGGLNDGTDATMKRYLGGVIEVPQDIIPTTVTSSGAVTGVEQSSGFSAMAMYTHYWAPRWRTYADAGYYEIFMPRAQSNGSGAGLNTQEGNGNAFAGGADLIWSPVRNFDIGAEFAYLRMQERVQNPDAAYIAAGEPGRDESGFAGVFRIQRTF
jgi:Porin subfamily